MTTTPIIADGPYSVDLDRFCGAEDPEYRTNCLEQPGHDGDHRSLTDPWKVTARDDAWGASFLERHPEISAAVPAWAENVDLNEVNDEYVAYRVSLSIGTVELASFVQRNQQDGNVTRADEILWMQSDYLDGDGLERQIRDLAIDLLLTAQKMEEVA